jgi:hypothetical protein
MNPNNPQAQPPGPPPRDARGSRADYQVGSQNASPQAQQMPPQMQGAPNRGPNGPQRRSNPNSTQNMLKISEIRDGIVIMNDGTFRAVIMCKSINFDLMSPEEREAVEYAYQGFLNSLYFPVQIFIRSEKVDIRPYLERMNKIRTQEDNMLLALLMEDYISFLSEIAQQTNIMDKELYLVISFPDPEEDFKSALKQSTGFFSGAMGLFSKSQTPHLVINESRLEQAKTELRTRVQAVMQGLLECGVQSVPLDTEELIELYYNVYNPDTATRQHLKNFEDMNVGVVTKGKGDAPQPHLDREML